MPEAAIAPPSTPTPKPGPSAPPKPPPLPPPPKPAPEPKPAATAEDPFARIDSRIGKKPEPAKTPEKKEGEPTKAEPKAPESKDARTIQAPKELRSQLEKIQGELKTTSQAKQQLEAKIADFEKRGKDTTALSERLAAVERERDEALATNRALRHESSDEFKAKWDKPFNRAAEYTKQLIEGLQVGQWIQNEDTGTREWKAERAATWDDFAALYQLPRGAKAAQAARALFGEDSAIVLDQLITLQKMDHERAAALEDERTQWKERESKDQAEQVRHREAFQAASAKVREGLLEQHPEWYAEDPEDSEGNSLLTDGLALLEHKPASMQEAVILHERMRLNAAAFPRLAHRYALAKDRISELESEIKELKDSGPGPTKGRSAEGQPEKSIWDEMRTVDA